MQNLDYLKDTLHEGVRAIVKKVLTRRNNGEPVDYKLIELVEDFFIDNDIYTNVEQSCYDLSWDTLEDFEKNKDYNEYNHSEAFQIKNDYYIVFIY